MSRRLLCDACSHRNEETSLVCGSCGHDLSYAEAVYGDAIPHQTPPPTQQPVAPTPAEGGAIPVERPAATPRSDGAVCNCSPASRVVGEQECWACGLRYPSVQYESQTPSDEVAALPSRSPSRLEFPNGQVVTIGQGLVLGREISSPPASGCLNTLPGVSRIHAWIGLDSAANLTVLDLGSRNGTWVSGSRLAIGIPRAIDSTSTRVELYLGGHCRLTLHSGDRA